MRLLIIAARTDYKACNKTSVDSVITVRVLIDNIISSYNIVRLHYLKKKSFLNWL